MKKKILLAKEFVPQPLAAATRLLPPNPTSPLLRILDCRTRLPDPFAAFLDYMSIIGKAFQTPRLHGLPVSMPCRSVVAAILAFYRSLDKYLQCTSNGTLYSAFPQHSRYYELSGPLTS